MRRLLVLPFLLVPAVSVPAQAGPSWKATTVLPRTVVGEPAVARNRDGSLVVAALGEQVGALVTEEGSRGFSPASEVDATSPAADVDVAVSAAGTTLFALLGNGEVHVCRKPAGAKGFGGRVAGSCSPVDAVGALADRPWLTTVGSSVVLTGSDLVGEPVAARTDDDGLTWLPCGPVVGTETAPWNGRPVPLGAHSLALVLNDRLRAVDQSPYYSVTHRRHADTLRLLRSDDDCRHWSIEDIAVADATAFTPVAAGRHLFVVTAEPFAVVVRRRDAAGWTETARIRQGFEVTLPAVVADRSGRVQVGWYGEEAPDSWSYFVGSSSDDGRTFSVEPVARRVATHRPVDEHASSSYRNLGELSALSYDRRGRLCAVYARELPGSTTLSSVLVSCRSGS